MIKSIYGGQGIIVNGGMPSVPYINMSNQSAGMVRFNGTIQSLEVYDGSTWYGINNTASMELSPEVVSILAWARNKQQEEKDLLNLSETNATIRDLVDQIKEKQKQIEVVKILIKEEAKLGTN